MNTQCLPNTMHTYIYIYAFKWKYGYAVFVRSSPQIRSDANQEFKRWTCMNVVARFPNTANLRCSSQRPFFLNKRGFCRQFPSSASSPPLRKEGMTTARPRKSGLIGFPFEKRHACRPRDNGTTGQRGRQTEPNGTTGQRDNGTTGHGPTGHRGQTVQGANGTTGQRDRGTDPTVFFACRSIAACLSVYLSLISYVS